MKNRQRLCGYERQSWNFGAICRPLKRESLQIYLCAEYPGVLGTLVNKDDSQNGIYVAVVLVSLATYFGSLNEPLPSRLH